MNAVPSLRHLEMFQLLMRTHNLTTTGRLMGVSQPAISLALKEVENQTGFRLLNRNNRRVEPTPEAVALQPEIERLFGQVGSLTRKISDLRNPGRGSIDIASVLSLTAAVLPRATTAFRRNQSGVRVGLHIHCYTDVVTLVREGAADIGFIYSAGGEYSQDPQEIMAEKLIETRMVCILNPRDPLARKDHVTLNDLKDRTLLLTSTQTVPGLLLRHWIMGRNGPSNSLDINNAFIAISLTLEGVGVGLTDPLLLASPCGREVVGRPLDPPIMLTMMMLIGSRDRQPRTALAFIRHVKAEAATEAEKLTRMGIDARICD